ncbi:MAG: epoxide hydrolase [Gammaproteobacteria bacterium]|nr:epoxide hydrolase [Gammaproteobacteria bacterium]
MLLLPAISLAVPDTLSGPEISLKDHFIVKNNLNPSARAARARSMMMPISRNVDRLAANADSILPFSISIEDTVISDLRERLERTRLPDQLEGSSWEYGTELDYLKALLDYWQHDFDWRAQESMLNAFDHYMTVIDDLSLHFIHQQSANEEAIPLLLVHGWPGSVSEFSKIIGPMADPEAHDGIAADSFHVIAPSLPGFGFSGKPTQPGMNPEKIALLLAKLMQRLGYERYALAGGDWGAIINWHLANHFPERLIGLHSNMMLAGQPDDPSQRDQIEPEEAVLVQARRAFMRNEIGYQQIQGTKPQTLGYSLADSPAGLAAWIVEKFHGWSDLDQGPDGNLDEVFTKDELLTNISIYWFTNTITSSTRIYYENRNVPASKPFGFIDVPTGAAIFPAELYMVPRAWAEAAFDLRHWTVMEKGGHFAALEQPVLYLEDVRNFFQLLRQ